MEIKTIQIPKIEDERGNLSFLEEHKLIPFEMERFYWIYDVPGGETRGSHAFRNAQEFIIALSGSFDVILNNGVEEKTYTLNRSYYGIYIPALTWKTLSNFSTNSVALVINSTTFNSEDYIRDFEVFKNKFGK